jgi:hypothetical protein
VLRSSLEAAYSAIVPTRRILTWYPHVIGAGAFVLAALALLELLLVPAPINQQVLLGITVTGRTAQVLLVAQIAFFTWVGWGSLARRRRMVGAAIGYAVYLIISVWVWTFLGGAAVLRNVSTALLVNATVTAMLLAFCRLTWQQQAAFDGDRAYSPAAGAR